MGSIPFSISTPCLLVFKKVKKVLISGIPSKAKILGLVFGRGTLGTGLMMIAFPMIYHAVRNAEEGIMNPKKDMLERQFSAIKGGVAALVVSSR